MCVEGVGGTCVSLHRYGDQRTNLWKFSPSRGTSLGLEAWCLHALGHLTRLYSSSPDAVRKATTKANTEECICTYSPRGLRVYRGREAWQLEHKLRVTSWVTSMSTEGNWNGVRPPTLEACLHDILPPTTGDQILSYVTVEDTLKSPHAAPKFCLSLQTASLFD